MSSQLPKADFSVVYDDDVPVVQLPPRLSAIEAVAFKEICHHVLAENTSAQKILLDFQQTQFIDSSGVGALVHNLKTTQEKQIELILQNVHPPVMAVLSMTGLDRVFQVASITDSVKNSFTQRSEFELPQTHPSVRSVIKRMIDIVGSLVGLGITATILVPIAVVIKKDSPGPIFFGQTRCGWMGKRFKIWKFRSMCVDAEARKHQVINQASGAIFKNTNDPRVTRAGRFLRRTSLDELPQFWNVLKGEMSLVGTRPPTPDEVERYEVFAWQRLNVKPGMTGEWQVNGRSQIRSFEEIIQLDLRYQRNWTLIYDLKLIAKTILLIFNKNSGAF